jgi:plasmid stability protein
MPTLNVRNFPEQWHKKLRHLAAESGQSVAAEVRALLIVALGGQKSVTGAPAKATVEPPAHQEAAPRPAPMKAPSSQPLAKARSKYGYNTGNESIDEYLEGENNEEMRKRIMTEHLYGGDVPEESRHNLWSRFCAAERKRSASTAA